MLKIGNAWLSLWFIMVTKKNSNINRKHLRSFLILINNSQKWKLNLLKILIVICFAMILFWPYLSRQVTWHSIPFFFFQFLHDWFSPSIWFFHVSERKRNEILFSYLSFIIIKTYCSFISALCLNLWIINISTLLNSYKNSKEESLYINKETKKQQQQIE
jgi:hypothetical protein